MWFAGFCSFALSLDALEEDRGWLVVRILVYKLVFEGLFEDGLVEALGSVF